jgi:uncharacterized protein (DUF486 family)
MTLAWYLNLSFKVHFLPLIILMSWGMAFFEYLFQVPANRIGSYQFSLVQLKTIQEIITLFVFIVFSIFYFKNAIAWNDLVAFGCVVVAVYFIFKNSDEVPKTLH